MGSPAQAAPQGRLDCRQADEASPPVPFQPPVCRSLPRSAAVCRPHGSGCDHGCSSLSAMSTTSCLSSAHLLIARPRQMYVPGGVNPGRRCVHCRNSSRGSAPTWTLMKGGGGDRHGGFVNKAALLCVALSSVILFRHCILCRLCSTCFPPGKVSGPIVVDLSTKQKKASD